MTRFFSGLPRLSRSWNRESRQGDTSAGGSTTGADSTKGQKLPREAMSQDVQMFMGRFQELRRKMGGMQSQQLKDAVCRELPDGSGIQVILGRELPVDEQALAADLEMLVERELGVRMKFQVHTPHNDPRPQEPVADLSGLIDMEIEIDAE